MSEVKSLMKTVREITLAPTGFEKLKESVISTEGIARRDDLLMQCDGVEVINTSAAHQVAANVLQALAGFLNEVEEGRKVLKAPFLAFGNKIDADAKELVKKLVDEKERLKGLIKAYLLKLEEEAIAEKQRQDAEIARLEAEKAALQAAPVTSETIKQQDAIDREIGKNLNPVTVEKPSGVSFAKVRKFRVVDINKFYAAHPQLCEITPRTASINALIRHDPNVIYPGLELFWDTNVTPRG